MPNTTKNLLLLRLDALGLDIVKVSAAVERAKQRGQYLREANAYLGPHIRELRTVRDILSALVRTMNEEEEIGELLSDASLTLERDLKQAPELVENVMTGVTQTVKSLKLAMATTVSLNQPSLALQQSLDQRCGELERSLSKLRTQVTTAGSVAAREHWETYQKLLDDVARPIFIEYVDFLGGLTVRDTGLDDLVCDMTEAVLGRFIPLTNRSLPLPGRQAALGNALDSVVLLGFPEWSIWGIPLVGHEVGLAYIKERKDAKLGELINRFLPQPSAAEDIGSGHDSRRAEPESSWSEELIEQLLADAFATYTMGLSYACAALLLRLNPRHDEPNHQDRPRDIDRARVIIMTLKAKRPSAPAAGGTFTDWVSHLENLWVSAVVAYAAPGEAGAARQEAEGPPPAEDRLDDLTRQAVNHFEDMTLIRPYNEERWRGSEAWFKALKEHDSAGPLWQPVEDVVPDVLTAAWRLRLSSQPEPNNDPNVSPNDVAAEVQKRWFLRPEGSLSRASVARA
jgi:hypothetical protein